MFKHGAPRRTISQRPVSRRRRAGRSWVRSCRRRMGFRLRGANLSLEGVEFGGGRVDLALQGLELLLRGRGRGLGLGQSPARRIDLALQAGVLARSGVVL